jgi:hypothetical protein
MIFRLDESSGDSDKDMVIQSLMSENFMFKSTMRSLNNHIINLEDRVLSQVEEIKEVNQKLDFKMDIVSKFLTKNGFRVEDLLEFENELKLNG